MKFMFFSFGLLFSLIFSYMNHPLTLGFLLMIQTLWISIIIGIISKTFWFSYILFITFLGGMLILFIYMTSLSSSDTFNFSFKMLLMIMFMMFNIIILWMMKDWFFINYFNNLDTMNNVFSMNLNLNTMNLNKLYNFPNNMMTIMLILYLLITLIIVVKITNMFYGPLRKNF
uniref:NADH-ubiquinone oxidoreductase chain 6 n=1 Tax=Dorcadia ioffi TaxID=2040515 RepID=A0A343KGF2_9NEOP|nr:NADH dehydrogenase subunit 6 [Dorcadia ioffi]ATF28034.1 NADH dehydrogenase subunit 6 [Dorcadia ioffi]